MPKNKSKQKILSGIVLILLIFNLVSTGIIYPKQAQAILGAGDIVTDIGNTLQNLMSRIQESAKWAWEQSLDLEDKASSHFAAVAFKASLHNFLRNLAIDTATWVATGDSGQKPMFITEGWGAYLRDAADQAAGTFLMTTASEWDRGSKYNSAYEDYYGCIEDCGTKECQDKCKADYERAEKEYASKATTVLNAGENYGNGLVSDITKFLCEPDLNIKLRITAGLSDIERPRPPKCTVSKARDNWDEFINDPDFLKNFQAYWDPQESDVGVTLSLYSEFLENRKATVDVAAEMRREGNGWKSVADFAGNILTPSSIVEKMGFKPIEEGATYESVNTGDIIADAISTFAQTLMGELLNKWVTRGIIGSPSDGGSFNWAKNYAFTSGSSATRAQDAQNNKKAAEEKFANTFRPAFNTGKSYSVLKELTICPNPKNAGPTECVIDESFANAIQQKLTVQEAINGGYIKKDVPFGFISGGLEPEYNQGYPYRSLVILRKYRIIPVGWEIAAQYAGEFDDRTYNIQEIISKYDDAGSPFYRLVDPNWVLKAPEAYCAAEGYGEKLNSEEVIEGLDANSDGDFLDKTAGDQQPGILLNRDKYCVDERSCIKEDADGNCLFYGYCTEEQRIWNFEGEKCDEAYNSCQTFTDAKGKQVSYIKNSLEFNGCSESNAGCGMYCESRNPSDDTWVCDDPGMDLVSNICVNASGCLVTDANDLDQDGDFTETCTVPYNGMECYLDSGARLTRTAGVIGNTYNDVYLNNNAETCSKEGEGCHEYIRTKSGLGTNLIVNPSFEGVEGILTDFWTVTNGNINTNYSFNQNYSFETVGNSSLEQAVDTGYSLIGRKFILSFYGRGDCASSGSFGFYAQDAANMYSSSEEDMQNSSNWSRYSVGYTFPASVAGYVKDITVQIGGFKGNDAIPANCYIDAVQLEEVRGITRDPSNFSGYQEKNLLYLKKAPDYYDCDKYTLIKDYSDKTSCGTAGFFWREKDQICVAGGYSACDNFAFECSTADVGCDLFKPANGDPGIPAVATADDYCPGECNGYDTYKQEATFLDSERFPEFLIPNNEKRCSAAYAGCAEFTNLDKIEEQGEALEYYVYLRPCKSIDNNCTTFYTWVGSDTTGFQLKAYSLQDADFNGEPDTVYATPGKAVQLFGECDNYNDAISNPECYQFYSEDGTISYHHYKDTRTCSNSCHPYRKTISNQTDCEADNSWGVWDVANQYCLYEGLETESIKCPASNSNCYEYKGNTSDNIRKIIDDDFEDVLTMSWLPFGGMTSSLSSESLARGGHSLKLNPGAATDAIIFPLQSECKSPAVCASAEGCVCQISGENVCYIQDGDNSCVYKSSLVSGRTYTISFWAKGSGDLTVKFSSAASGDEFAARDISLGPDWLEYSLGPVFIHDGWDMTTDSTGALDEVVISAEETILEYLQLSGFTGEAYVDNIILKEIRDDLFLIRPDLWNVPQACNQNLDGNFAPQYMIGCEEYTSSIEKNKAYLKSFNHLCSEEVIGCEAIIDTANSGNPNGEIFNSGDNSETIVSPDKMVALVNDKEKQCRQAEKGCTALGKANYKYNTHNTDDLADDTDDLYSYETVYYLNNSDKYDDFLCQSDAVGCQEFNSDKGPYYFKDPKYARTKDSPKTCEYKVLSGQLDPRWYIKETEILCPTLYSETGIEYASSFLLGGAEFFNWSAECPADADTCTEYIDPQSKISKNIIFNSDFTQDVDTDGNPDGWNNVIGYYQLEEPLYIEPNTLYTVMGFADAAGGEIKITGCSSVTSLDNSINLIGGEAILSTAVAGQFSGRFYSEVNTECTLLVSASIVSAGEGGIRISKTGIYYYLDDSLNKNSCGGIVDYEKGCVLVNSRDKTSNGAYLDITYDADLNNPMFSACLAGECDTNLLIKARPDRSCGEWLYCKSMVEIEGDNTGRKMCLETGLCNSVNGTGACNGFPVTYKQDQTFTVGNMNEIRDRSGFVDIGRNWGADGLLEGSYPFNEMNQEGGKILIINGDFELVDSINNPIGWKYDAAAPASGNSYTVISDPISSQREGLSIRAPQGKGYLKKSHDGFVSTDRIDINFIDESFENKYFLSAYLNTSGLFSGKAQIKLLGYDTRGVETDLGEVLYLDYGKDWEFLSNSVTIPGNIKWVKVVITSENAEGYFYIDDVKMKPVLNSSFDSVAASEKYTPQDCRAYPKNNSLACEYIDSAGVKNLGWNGYCLQYDRSPGNKNQCLVWWPVDIPLGEGGNEKETGYSGKYPVYYCLEAQALQVLEYRKNPGMRYQTGDSCDGYPAVSCPTGYGFFGAGGCGSGTLGSYYCYPSGTCYDDCDSSSSYYSAPCTAMGDVPGEDGWYEFNGFQVVPSFGWHCPGTDGDLPYDEASMGVKFRDPATGEIYDDTFAYCTRFASAVDSMGNNMYWSGRVYEGSEYRTVDYKYGYSADSAPFGSMAPPDPTNNPLLWDGNDESSGIQPIYVSRDTTVARAGQPRSFANLPAGISAGACAVTGEACLTFVGSTYSTNKADCPSGTGPCNPAPNLTLSESSREIKRIFSQSYGAWYWDSRQSRYVPATNLDWTPPENLCAGNPPSRPQYNSATGLCGGGSCIDGCGSNPTGPTCDYCGVPPKIKNVKINSQGADNYYINNSGVINFTFNSIADINQSPLIMYVIDWGDGTDSDMNIVLGSGINVNSRPNEENPHSFYHLYGYWDMLAKDITSSFIKCGDAGDSLDMNSNFDSNGDGNLVNDQDVTCDGSPCCATRIRAKIKDNWGWCNGDLIRGECDFWNYYGEDDINNDGVTDRYGYVVVNQFGDLSGACESECAPGSAGCNGTVTWNCQLGGNGCYTKAPQIDCALTAQVCSNGVCVDGCISDCNLGDVGCDAINRSWYCAANPTDGCNDIIIGDNCTALGEVCDAGICQPSIVGGIHSTTNCVADGGQVAAIGPGNICAFPVGSGCPTPGAVTGINWMQYSDWHQYSSNTCGGVATVSRTGGCGTVTCDETGCASGSGWYNGNPSCFYGDCSDDIWASATCATAANIYNCPGADCNYLGFTMLECSSTENLVGCQ